MNVDMQAHEAALQFELQGKLVSIARYGSGHINDSYCAVVDRSGATNGSGQTARYIIQRINSRIFTRPQLLMENIHRVTSHLATQLNGNGDRYRRVLTLTPARDGRLWHIDDQGCYWRAYRFIEGAHTYDSIQSPSQAYHAARAFGQFQQMLVNLPSPRLHETLPDFHNTPRRLEFFIKTLEEDRCNRAREARLEIDYALAQAPLAELLIRADLPERVIHADTKINNVLLDDANGEGLCVIDLDTVMPGLSLYDFGDMVRTATSPAAEDERDLTKVAVQVPMFEALVRGYLASTTGFLTAQEKSHLVSAGKLLAFEQGIRFLSDFLNGDVYYKTTREKHNLDRCRTQFKLLRSIEEHEDEMHRCVEQNLA